MIMYEGFFLGVTHETSGGKMEVEHNNTWEA